MVDSLSEESDHEPSYKSEGDDDGYAGAEVQQGDEDEEEEWDDRPRHREVSRGSM